MYAIRSYYGNWIYDEEKELKLFSNLDESFSCPICGAEKSAFVKEKFHGEEYVKTTVADKIVEQLVITSYSIHYTKLYESIERDLY